MKEDKERLTDHFMQALPPLLEKYGVDSDKLTNLLCIPQYFDLERYTSSRQEGVCTIYLSMTSLHKCIKKEII